MKKIGKGVLSPVVIIGMLTMLIVSSYIYMSGTTNQSVQNLETNPVILQTRAENNALDWYSTWGGGNNEYGFDIVMDASGSLYCVGNTNSFGVGNDDFALVKFAPNGTRLWNTTWGGTGNDHGESVAVDANGTIYCLGYTNSFGKGNNDFALIKFAPNGTQLWNTTWGSTGFDYGYDLAVDANGYIFCLGSGNYDLALIKFAPNRTQLWNTTWGGAGFDGGNSVAVDASGEIYCFGSTNSFGAGSYDFALVKFAPNGTRLWNTTWGGAGNDVAESVAVDASGSIYCVGGWIGVGGGSDLALLKYSPSGTLLWNTTWGISFDDKGNCVTVDANGYLYCVGETYNELNDTYNLFLVKYAPTGTRLWNLTWGGPNEEVGESVVVDASGSLYCVGMTSSFGMGFNDFVLLKFSSPAGGSDWLFILLIVLIPMIGLALGVLILYHNKRTQALS